MLLRRKITVKQRLSDAETLSELARLPGEADLGEKADRLRDDLLLAIGGTEPLGGERGAAVLAACRAAAQAVRTLIERGYGSSPFAGMMGSSR
jgi:hypothetical protein